MSEIYLEYHFTVNPKEPATEMLIAELSFVGFESFVENEDGVSAYIQKEEWNATLLDSVFVLHSDEFDINYTFKEIAQVNWNNEWEKNFKPIQVDNEVSIRAPFHENPTLLYDIVIEPKMSFGTGHHETTYMMIQQLLAMNVSDLKTLDMGCGTGVLAIFSEMKGAKPIDAVDIDSWCYKNTFENIERNHCKHISVYEGDVSFLKGKNYDLIMANINRNILANDITAYNACLSIGGVLLLSGFYREDIPYLDKEATRLGLQLSKTLYRNNWVSLKYQKNA